MDGWMDAGMRMKRDRNDMASVDDIDLNGDSGMGWKTGHLQVMLNTLAHFQRAVRVVFECVKGSASFPLEIKFIREEEEEECSENNRSHPSC